MKIKIIFFSFLMGFFLNLNTLWAQSLNGENAVDTVMGSPQAQKILKDVQSKNEKFSVEAFKEKSKKRYRVELKSGKKVVQTFYYYGGEKITIQ